MKSLIATLAAAAVLAVPAVSFAQQDNGALTRAQVKAELSTLEQAGYTPGTEQINYPANIQAAEARVHPQQNVAATADSTGYGSEPLAKREAGGPARVGRIADGAPAYPGR